MMQRKDLRRVEVREEAMTNFIEDVDARSEGSVWTSGGCNSYYLDDTGRQFAIYPGFVSGFRRRTRRFDLKNYETRELAA